MLLFSLNPDLLYLKSFKSYLTLLKTFNLLYIDTYFYIVLKLWVFFQLHTSCLFNQPMNSQISSHIFH